MKTIRLLLLIIYCFFAKSLSACSGSDRPHEQDPQLLCGFFPRSSILTNSSFRGFQSSRRRTKRALQDKESYQTLLNTLRNIRTTLEAEPPPYNKADILVIWNLGGVLESPPWKNTLSPFFIEKLSRDTLLTPDFINICRQFFLHFKKISPKLPWEIYRELSAMQDERERNYYHALSILKKWNLTALRRALENEQFKHSAEKDVSEILNQPLELLSPDNTVSSTV